MTDLMGKYNGSTCGRRRLVSLGPHTPWMQALCLAMFLALVGMAGQTFAVPIALNTTALAGMEARLDFTIVDGDFTDNNSATIADIMTDGTLQATTCIVSCVAVGAPPSFIISDMGGLGQFLQDLILGNVITFDIAVTTNFAGSPGAPDRVSLLLLNPLTNLTLVDTDLDFPSAPVPVQDALLIIDLIGGAQGVNISLATVTDPAIGVTVIPEPGTLSLLLLGLSLFLWLRMRRQYRA